MRLATAYVCGRASAGLFTALLDCVANGASRVSACFVSLRAWYDASLVAIRWWCVFRQEDICTVLVSKIVFLQELDPGVCGRSVLGRC